MGLGSIVKSIGKIAGIAAAPFTGGTSLLASTALDVGTKLFEGSMARDAASTAYARSMDASNTSYQRAVADMRAAGLNPILAYSQGGASTPQATAAQVPSLTPAATNALQLAQAQAGVANTAQATRTSASDEALNSQSAEKLRLENEGLRVLPPEYRAAAGIFGSTASGLSNIAGGFGKLGSKGALTIGSKLKGAVSPLKKFVPFLKKGLSK